MHKKRHRETAFTRIVWIDHSVSRAFIETVCQILQHVPGIHDDLSGVGLNRSPGSIALKKLKSTGSGFAE